MGQRMKHTDIGDIPADWKLQTFEETFRVLSNNTLSRENLNNKGGAVRNIHYGDILTKFPEVLNCNEEDIPYLNDLSLITANTQLLQNGDIVIADTAEDETVGKTIEVQNLGDGKLVAGLHTIPCRVKKGSFAPGWLGYYMNSHIYHDQIIPFITGIKVSSISKGAIAETIILIPPVEEQKRIIETLSQIDKLIKQEKTVSEKLKAFKAGCLSRMFPKNDKKKPEIRYPEYTKEWGYQKLADYLIEITYGFTNPMSDTEAGPWKITAKDVVDGKINFSTARHTSDSEYERLTNKSKPQIGDLLLTKDGTLGRTALVNVEKICINQSVALLRFDKELCLPSFIKILLDSPLYQKIMLDDAGGGTIKHIYITKVDKMIVSIPSKDEQIQLVSFFKSLDTLIMIHKSKYTKYMSIKAGLISKLISMK